MTYVTGEGRHQSALLPPAIEDYVEATAPVRIIDAFVDCLDFSAPGFTRAAPASTGRSGYDPRELLKLYIYGYFNEVRSSRRLERECKRNLELMWLVCRLAPDHKTIADFRRDNGPAVVGACSTFVLFCRDQGLYTARLVAIDGAKFRAAASTNRVMDRRRIALRRKCSAEHPFGTMKRMMAGRFLTRGLGGTRTEMALSVLAYNMIRSLNLRAQAG